jgi:hypothetical protein
MQISDKLVDEFRTIMEKRGAKFKDGAEVRVAAENLAGFVELAYEVAVKEMRRKKKLKEHRKGFAIDEDGVFSCFICFESITKENGWYDKYGFKCLNCQRAVDEKIIPPIVFKDRHSWLATWQVQDRLKIHPATMRKMIREGQLKPRIITYTHNINNYYIFMLSENSILLTDFNT